MTGSDVLEILDTLNKAGIDAEGGGVQRLQDGSSYRYPPQGFKGKGLINGYEVKCLTLEVQAECHYGYEPDEKDRHDLKLLQAFFNIELKSPYTD